MKRLEDKRENHVGWLLAVTVTLALLLGGCQGTKIAESQPTAVAQAAKPMYDYRQVKLANGLDVITLEDFSCPIVAVQIWYHVGSKDEQPDRQGFAHMFEHMMFRGTDVLGPTDHFSLISSVGGTTNGFTGFDRTVYVETLPAEQLDLALWLEADRMAFLRIDQNSYDTERKVVEEERRMGLNQPYGTLFEDLFAEAFKVHPYRWTPIGKIPDLRAAHLKEVRDFWRKYYVPSNATLIIVGAVTHERAQAAAKKYFGWMPKYDEPPRVTVVEPPMEGRSVTLKEKNAPAPGAGVVYHSVPLRDKDSIVFDVMAQILGGGNSSRLYRELVAEKQLAVGAEAENFSLEQDGLFGAGALLPPFGSDTNAVLGVLSSDIEELRAEPVSDRELTKAKNQLMRGVVTQNLRIDSKARMLGSAAVELGDVSRVNTYLPELKAMTRGDVLRVANDYLKPERALKVTVPRNLLGAVVGGKDEEESGVTAEPETEAPTFGRPGVRKGVGFPNSPPIAQSTASRAMPEYSSKMLDNGLKVVVVENHEVPFVSVTLGLLAGAWTEEKVGVASMAMQMLTKGTSKHSEGELADELETYAIELSGSGSMDTATVGMSCLSEHLERGMDLLSEVVLTPTFPEEEFVKQRKKVLTSLEVSSASPEYQAEKEFRHRLYGQHPYSRTATGEIEDVNVLTVEDLKSWWGRFARPDMAVLIFAGDITKQRVFELGQAAFEQWSASGPRPAVELPALQGPEKTHIYLVDRPGSVQSQIRMGHLGITRHDAGYFVSRVVSNYFGWAFNSRLNEKVRVEKGLTYGVWGGYQAHRFAGEFKLGTFSKTESTAEAVEALIAEIERLKTEPPSDDELNKSRSYLLGSFVRQRETPQQIAGDIWLIESQGLGSDYLERFLAGIAETKQQDCVRLVERSVEPKNLVVVVVGRAQELQESLEKIAPVTVVPAAVTD